VILVSGPVAITAPSGVRIVNVTSALQMRSAVLNAARNADAIVMAAAVGDYRPVNRFRGKMKKTRDRLTLDLVRNPDILRELGHSRMRRRLILIGFSLEASRVLDNARSKLAAKNLDLIVANDTSAFGADASTIWLIARDGTAEKFTGLSKRKAAVKLVKWIENAFRARSDSPTRH
jgi:phosphopantothenoylcysteine decarboxylase/phosphopantothenate--cysteine ligase